MNHGRKRGHMEFFCILVGNGNCSHGDVCNEKGNGDGGRWRIWKKKIILIIVKVFKKFSRCNCSCSYSCSCSCSFVSRGEICLSVYCTSVALNKLKMEMLYVGYGNDG